MWSCIRKCWARCKRAWGQLLGREAKGERRKKGNNAGGQTSAGYERGSGGRSDQEDGIEEVSGVGEDIAAEGMSKERTRNASRKELMRHLRRKELVFQSADVRLRIMWRIQFDWTGEAESVVQAHATFPAAWRDADERKSLYKVPATFDSLVRERGVFEAIRVVVGLLF